MCELEYIVTITFPYDKTIYYNNMQKAKLLNPWTSRNPGKNNA